MQPTITPEYLASQGLSPKFAKRFWRKVNKNSEAPSHMQHLGTCWEWTAATNPGGYGIVQKDCLHGTPVGTILAHRASFLLVFGKITDGMHVCHKCDNPRCVRPDHLFEGTRVMNMKDSANKGRNKWRVMRGEEQPRHKLSNSQILAIRKEYKPRWGNRKRMAQKYGVSDKTICDIIHRKSWKHI